MKKKELRIGSYVLLEKKHYHKITGDDLAALDDVAHNKGKRIFHAKPIPLTPPILTACGFHKFNNAWVPADYDETNYMHDYFTVWNLHDGEYKLNTTQFAIEITSLHQLQTIYFALTGQELTIKL